MFSRLSRIFRNKVTRNAFAFYFGSHLLSIALLLFLIYFLLSSALTKNFKQLIEAKENELIALYKENGLDALKKNQAWAYVRVLDQDQKVLSQSVPGDLSEFDLNQLNHDLPISEAKLWSTINKTNDEDKLYVLTEKIGPRLFLQVGKSDGDLNDSVELLLEVYLGIIGPLLIILLMGAFIFADKLLVQFYGLISTLGKIKSGAIHERAKVDPSLGELNELLKLFNIMMDQIEVLIEKTRSEVDQFAHDIRTPLTQFRLLAEKALIEKDDIGLLRLALEEAVGAADHIESLITSIFDISLTESGSIRVKLESVCLFDIVTETLELFEWLAEEKNVSIHATLRSQGKIKADYLQLKRVLSNLFDNALKFSSPGKRIDILLFEEANQIKLVIRDQGPGIEKQELNLIWTRFFRGKNVPNSQGFGLGLSFVKAMTDFLGGKVFVQSEVGIGSEFMISFPIES